MHLVRPVCFFTSAGEAALGVPLFFCLFACFKLSEKRNPEWTKLSLGCVNHKPVDLCLFLIYWTNAHYSIFNLLSTYSMKKTKTHK